MVQQLHWDGDYPTLKLSGLPEISGDIYLNDWEDSSPVIEIADGFEPVSPIELNANYANTENGITVIRYTGNMEPDPAQFKLADIMYNYNKRITLKVSGQTLEWAEKYKVLFKDEDNSVVFKEIFVIPDMFINAAEAPAPEKAGYTLAGWRAYGSQAMWNFATNQVSKTSQTLLAVWKMDAPEVSIKADATTIHAKTTMLTAQPTHGAAGVAYSYQWMKDGKELAGETGDTLKVSESGSYTVKVQASDGAQVSAAESAPILLTVEGHVFETEWKFNATHHWHECACGEKADFAEHISDHGVITKNPTQTEDGIKTYSCTECNAVLKTEAIPATGEEIKAVIYTDPATGITLIANTTLVPEGSRLIVKQSGETSADYAAAKKALKDNGGKFAVYDIALVNAAGEQIQPNGAVLIGIPAPAGYDQAKLSVYRIDGDYAAIKLNANTYDGITYFQTEYFGNYYALLEEGSMSGEDDANIPKTGDTASMMPYILFAVFSGAVIVLCVLMAIRKKRDEK